MEATHVGPLRSRLAYNDKGLDAVIYIFPTQVAFPDSSQNTEAFSVVLQDNSSPEW